MTDRQSPTDFFQSMLQQKARELQNQLKKLNGLSLGNGSTSLSTPTYSTSLNSGGIDGGTVLAIVGIVGLVLGAVAITAIFLGRK